MGKGDSWFDGLNNYGVNLISANYENDRVSFSLSHAFVKERADTEWKASDIVNVLSSANS